MSLVATAFKDGPRLARRQTTMGVVDRPPSPSRHMRLVSACAALPPTAAVDKQQDQVSARPTRSRSSSTMSPLSLPALRQHVPTSGASSPSSAGSPVSPAALYSPHIHPRSPLAHHSNSYFPPVPSQPETPPLSSTKAGPMSLSPASAKASSGATPQPPAPPHQQQSHKGTNFDSPSTPLLNHDKDKTRPTDLVAVNPIPPLVASIAKPGVIDLHRPTITIPSPLSKATAARMPEPGDRPPVDVQSTRFSHTLSVHLPGYAGDEVTLTVGRNDAIKIVADKWSAAADDKCHLEWLVSFAARDVNMTGIHASFANSILCVTVPRVPANNGYYLSSRAF